MTNSSSPAFGKKLVLILLFLSLGLILGAALAYRISSPFLVAPGPRVEAVQPASMPDMPPAGEMGQSLDEAGQTRVMAAMQRLQTDPNDVETLLELADVFMQRGNFVNAQGFINRALVAAPSDASPSYYQGVLKAKQAEYGEAAEFMERALALSESPATRYSLAVLYIYHLQQPEKGREHLRTALEQQDLPSDLRALLEEEWNK